MVLELYMDLLSAPCRAVYIFARKNGIPFEFQFVDLLKGVMLPSFLSEPVAPETLTATLAELERNLKLLQDKFLQDKAFLAGPHISVADLVAVTELMHPVSAGCQVFEGRPKLAAWRQRVEAAVGQDLFQEAHEFILQIKDISPADSSTKRALMPGVRAMLQ
ncbi:glutathione S-transferase theta-4 isoform X3 [Echinops telfairi]|uniref:Glutathione S-transferase theta-4 isoform X3 n=1 Tax=Echinops telfairi TaxID=9371 RepID=A0ABM0ZTP2_ECHTE|nr:glutathione S-transferase theta-4 isoform X3 [Echinops telfairi]